MMSACGRPRIPATLSISRKLSDQYQVPSSRRLDVLFADSPHAVRTPPSLSSFSLPRSCRDLYCPVLQSGRPRPNRGRTTSVAQRHPLARNVGRCGWRALAVSFSYALDHPEQPSKPCGQTPSQRHCPCLPCVYRSLLVHQTQPLTLPSLNLEHYVD